MRKTSFEYHIHGYRYAPESFHIYKGLPGQEKASGLTGWSWRNSA